MGSILINYALSTRLHSAKFEYQTVFCNKSVLVRAARLNNSGNSEVANITKRGRIEMASDRENSQVLRN